MSGGSSHNITSQASIKSVSGTRCWVTKSKKFWKSWPPKVEQKLAKMGSLHRKNVGISEIRNPQPKTWRTTFANSHIITSVEVDPSVGLEKMSHSQPLTLERKCHTKTFQQTSRFVKSLFLGFHTQEVNDAFHACTDPILATKWGQNSTRHWTINQPEAHQTQKWPYHHETDKVTETAPGIIWEIAILHDCVSLRMLHDATVSVKVQYQA